MADHHQRSLRLPPSMAKRLQREADEQRLSANTYIQLAVKEKLEADEARRKELESSGRRPKRAEDGYRAPGLGLRPPAPPEAAILPRPAELPASLVVNVGGKEQTLDQERLISAIAEYATTGAALAQQERQRAAVEILRIVGKSQQEREELAQKLDAEMDKRTQRRPIPSAGSFKSGRIGRIFG